MKIVIRMLASILPGVVVGFGVIIYLERDHLQEEWSSVFGSHEPEIHVVEMEERVDLPSPVEVVPPSEPAPSGRIESSATIFEPEPEPEPEPESKSEPEPKLEPKQKEVVVQDAEPAPAPAPALAPALAPAPALELAQIEAAPAKTKMDAPAEPELVESPIYPEITALDEVLGLDKRGVGEVASIASIEELAERFNPLQSSSQAPYEVMEEKRESDIWHIGSLESESQLQWLRNRGRQAFWEGDYELAVESYRSLLQEDPMNPDGWGELGNIYYAQRDWTRAVRAFGRAADTLRELQRIDEAEKIVTIIRGIDPALADQLSADLAQRASQDQ